MTISDKIFELLKEKNMTQKEFSKLTGIAESSISDWKRKHTNPSADCILPICKALSISPDELLSGTKNEGEKKRQVDYYIVTIDSAEGQLIESYQGLDTQSRGRLEGYLKAINELAKASK